MSPMSTSSLTVMMCLVLCMGTGVRAYGYRYAPILGNGLSMGYYIMSCPMVELIVRNGVSKALQSDSSLAGPLLRMHFHDCWIQGCDGSILIDSTKDNKAEKDSPANLSLRGFEVIDDIKEELEEQCPGVVSCADIVAMVARDVVFLSGGPIFGIPQGRKDGRRSKIADTANLPPFSFNASDLIKAFGSRGFTVQEMVVLSGAHTLGVARCSSFKNRLAGADPMMNRGFSNKLAKVCAAGDTAEQGLDPTSNTFDNMYFQQLQKRAGVMTSDQTLFSSSQTQGYVNGYAMNPALFFIDFQQALTKLGMLDVKQESQGEVRTNCRRVN